MSQLIKRNLKVFFRDRTAVFFSLLSVVIIIGLYVLFLGDTIVADMDNIPGARFLMDSWIMAGLLAVTSVTTTLGAASTMVDDYVKGISKDFHCSPLPRWAIAGGYLGSIFIVGISMTILAFILAEAYIVVYGGQLLPLLSVLKVLGLILLSVIAGSSMVFFLVSFFKTQSSFGVASTIIGTLIGFLTGIYVPISVLPTSIRFVIKVFPVSHAAALFRQVLMEIPIQEAFAGAPPPVVRAFKLSFGVFYEFSDTTLGALESTLILALTALLFFGMSVHKLVRK